MQFSKKKNQKMNKNKRITFKILFINYFRKMDKAFCSYPEEKNIRILDGKIAVVSLEIKSINGDGDHML
jgi:hypothetical protein